MATMPVLGGGGNDVYNFKSLDQVSGTAVGRIEDFDNSRDEIHIEGVKLDFNNLPSNVRIVEYNGTHDDVGSYNQQWLLIETASGGHVFYSLEGARVDMDGTGASAVFENGVFIGTQERHFLDSGSVPVFEDLVDVEYVDQVNTVPDGVSPSGGDIINDFDRIPAHALEVILGTSSGDLIAAGLNDDTVNAGGGNDIVWGGSGHDILNGDEGDDTLYGGTGDDLFHGGTEDDFLYGEDGDDTLFGDTGDDTLHGGDGEDNLYGGAGNDTLYGAAGNDYLKGHSGNDYLKGHSGNDRLRGGTGNDVLKGGSGNDTLEGDEVMTRFMATLGMIRLMVMMGMMCSSSPTDQAMTRLKISIKRLTQSVLTT